MIYYPQKGSGFIKQNEWLRKLVDYLNDKFSQQQGGGYDGNPNTIQQDATHRFATDSEKTTWNGKQDALGFTPVNTNDSRLSDARTPLAHTHPQSDVTNLVSALAGKAASSHTHAESDITNLVSDLAGKSAVGHTHVKSEVGLGNVDNTADTAKPVSTAQQTALDLKANLASPAFTGTPTGITKSHVGLGNVDNTSDANKPVSTATQTALNLKTDLTVLNTFLSQYKTILEVSGSHTAAKVAGTYALGQGDPIAVSGTGTLYPIATIYIAAADFPTVNSLAAKLRIRAQLYTNDVAPTGNFTFGLYPITRPGTSGGTGVCIYTIGTVVSGSNGATFTTPAADGLLNAVGSDFSLPADGHYIIAVVTTATIATNAHVHMTAQLQQHNA